jgi:hypothetical protein
MAEFTFFLEGDLSQMAGQRNFLNARGIETQQKDVYPCVREHEVKEALTMIWENKIEGWWHYGDEYPKYSVCTKEEFLKSF